jgi:anti-sigma-K factor RskA
LKHQQQEASVATIFNRLPPAQTDHEVLEATDARQGRWGRHAFWMLIASTTLAVIALFLAWAFYSGAFTTLNEARTPTPAEARATTGPVSNVKQ